MEEVSSDEEPSAVDSSLVSPEFKAYMDNYEDFMDSYIELMQKYYDNPSDTSLLLQYSEFLGKYEDFAEKIDTFDESSLPPADYAYYLLVTARVEKKLVEAAIKMP